MGQCCFSCRLGSSLKGRSPTGRPSAWRSADRKAGRLTLYPLFPPFLPPLKIDRNPITLNGTSSVSTKVKRNAKTEPKTEWGLIDTEVGLVVHVMTAAARARWALEGIWSDPDA